MVLIQPCRTSAAYEVIPERRLRLDITALEKNVQAGGWEVLVNGGIILVVRKGKDDASIFNDGKVLIKTQERAVAERVWSDLKPLIPA